MMGDKPGNGAFAAAGTFFALAGGKPSGSEKNDVLEEEANLDSKRTNDLQEAHIMGNKQLSGKWGQEVYCR